VHLTTFVQAYGTWVYALLFTIIFVETGIVVMPFLPGDSLLFVVGAMCAVGLMSLPLAIVLLWIAAVLGDQCNYTIGRYIGPRVFQWENSRWFNKKAFDQAHAFYERYGGITVIGARFLPFLRTFVPFVAGVAEMTRSKFSFYNVSGGLLWVGSLTVAGYVFGNIPWVKENLDKIIWAAILIPGLLVFIGAWRARRKQAAEPGLGRPSARSARRGRCGRPPANAAAAVSPSARRRSRVASGASARACSCRRRSASPRRRSCSGSPRARGRCSGGSTRPCRARSRCPRRRVGRRGGRSSRTEVRTDRSFHSRKPERCRPSTTHPQCAVRHGLSAATVTWCRCPWRKWRGRAQSVTVSTTAARVPLSAGAMSAQEKTS
jgi:membrane-associated protein